MRRIFCAVFMMLTTSALIASDAIFQLSGWAEIPSTYRHPGPVSHVRLNIFPDGGVSRLHVYGTLAAD